MTGRRKRTPAALATLGVAAGSGFVADLFGLPLPWLLGSLLGTAALAISGMRIAGAPPSFPSLARTIAVPVIGVMIGASVTGELFSDLGDWWPSLALLVPFILALQIINFAIFRRVGGYDLPTAFFAASPGGLIESVLIGESRGGNVALMSVQHFSRIALSVLLIPILFTWATGQSVGSAAGASLAAPAAALSPPDLALLAAAGGLGFFLAHALRVPAAIIVGPFVASAAIHIAGLTQAAVPPILVIGAQIVIGMLLGLHFVGRDRKALVRGMGLACIALGVSLSLAATCALLLAAWGVAPREAIFLAFAPGGLAEMSLIAVSLGISPVFVTAHHVLRIVVAISLSSLVFKLVCRLLGATPPR